MPKNHIEILLNNRAALVDQELIKSNHIRNIINYINNKHPIKENI